MDAVFLCRIVPDVSGFSCAKNYCSETSFNVPPSGLCFVPSGGDCFRCDCMKPLKCYKGVCR
ncbi:hypothetical protein ANCCAN_05562 [Ancylostoma caninum]|uniref:Uncharacterized protein n=1 Tax=Ancylostoma caninum TaxID=29170 RepID=A0A368GVS3_ANCCA|nr:hypothetical protein ANCCAN_05562 [Ancylostoma caninum]